MNNLKYFKFMTLIMIYRECRL